MGLRTKVESEFKGRRLCGDYKNHIATALLGLILPLDRLDYCTIVDFQQGNNGQYIDDKTLKIFLEEKDIVPDEYNSYKCSGFMEPRLLNDCPIHSMLVNRSAKPRCWAVKLGERIRNAINNLLSIPVTSQQPLKLKAKSY